MSKTAITAVFILAILAVVGGVAIGLVAVVTALAGGAISIGGPSVVSVNGAAVAGTLVWYAIASLVIGAGQLAALAAWIGALLNTWKLEDKTWFTALLVVGACSAGWVAVAAFVLRGPDGTKPGAARPASARLPAPEGSQAV